MHSRMVCDSVHPNLHPAQHLPVPASSLLQQLGSLLLHIPVRQLHKYPESGKDDVCRVHYQAHSPS